MIPKKGRVTKIESEKFPEEDPLLNFRQLIGQKVPLTLQGIIVGEGTVGEDGLITDIEIDTVIFPGGPLGLQEVARTDTHIYLSPMKATEA